MALWDKIKYSSGIAYLNNVFIYEVDIEKANINILYSKGLITKDIYDYLYNSERMVRQVYIGKLQRDVKYTKALQQGIIEAKAQLFQANDIKDFEVLSIKNDAVFLINRIPSIRDFGLIHFIPKNVYTSFYTVGNLEMYYYYNSISKEEKLDIKGLGDSVIETHRDYMYQFLCDLFYTIQCNGIEVAIRLMKEFYIQYINLKLPLGYYRKFDISNEFHFKSRTSMGTGYSINNINESMLPLIDISYNLRILITLQKILDNMYFNKFR